MIHVGERAGRVDELTEETARCESDRGRAAVAAAPSSPCSDRPAGRGWGKICQEGLRFSGKYRSCRVQHPMLPPSSTNPDARCGHNGSPNVADVIPYNSFYPPPS